MNKIQTSMILTSNLNRIKKMNENQSDHPLSEKVNMTPKNMTSQSSINWHQAQRLETWANQLDDMVHRLSVQQISVLLKSFLGPQRQNQKLDQD